MRRPSKAIAAIFASLLSMLALGVGSAAAAAPTLTVDAPSSVSYTTAHLSGAVNPNGGPGAGFIGLEYRRPAEPYWTFAKYQSFEGAETEGTSPIALEADVTGLVAGVEYEVRVHAGIGGEQYYSPEPNPSFTTTPISAPSLTLDPPSAVGGTTAHFAGTIDPESPPGNPPAADVNWHFECTPACPGLSGTIAADSASHAVSGDATGLLPNTDYEVKLVAKNAGEPVSTTPATFKTQKVAPIVEALYPTIAFPQVTLRGQINPRNSATNYQFEWGPTASYGSSVPAVPASLGATDNSSHTVSAALSDLTPGTTYHYRLVATNTESSQVAHGPDHRFTTPAPTSPSACPNEVFRVGFAASLPDCRAYEQVTPIDKEGLEPLLSEGIFSDNFLLAPSGERVGYIYPGAFGDSPSSVLTTRYESRRSADGWTTHGVEIGQAASPEFAFPSTVATSPDLSHAIVYSHRAFAPGAVAGNFNVYLQDNATGALEFMLTSPTMPNIVQNGTSVNIGGTPDFSHVVMREWLKLTPDAPPSGTSRLYEFSNGQLRFVSYKPDGEPNTGSIPNDIPLSQAISADGSHFVYTLSDSSNESNWGSSGVYERVNGQTTAISVSERTGEEGRVVGGSVKYISPDGSTVYFTTLQPLTDAGGELGSGFGGGWLYKKEGSHLTELTHREGSVEPNVEAILVGDEGNYVYAVERSGIFVWHAGQVTRLFTEDIGAGSNLKAGVSPNGRYLAFATLATPTGFDSENMTKCFGAIERGFCSEIYIYDAVTSELECASCRTDGSRPIGPSNFGAATRGAYVSDDGTVFFNSQDPLVPGDVNGRTDTYQFRRGVPSLLSTGTSSRPAYFGGASGDGRNVYFSTDAQLVGQDADHLVDFYDARVDGGLEGQYPPEPPAACEGEACKGPISSPPDTGAPGTSSFVGGSQGTPRAVSPRCRTLASKARTALKKAKAKPRGKQRQKALKHAKQLQKKAGKCKAGGA